MAQDGADALSFPPVPILPEPYESIRREAGIPVAGFAGAILGAWLVPGLLAGTETWAFWLLADEPTPPWRAFAAQVPGWLTFGLLTPLILRLGEWIPLASRPRTPRLFAHLLLALGSGAAFALVAATAWSVFLGARMPFPRLVLSWYLAGLPTAVLCYFVVLGGGRAIYWFWRHRDAELETARLEARLADARLDALRMQLDPHFFFNSLNTVTVLVRDGDAAAAEEVLEALGELLRETLRGRRSRTSPLSEEVGFIRRYLAIEQARFSDRLRVEIDVPAELAGTLVPTFVLQPLVENAVRHGISRRPGAGRIGIRARREDGRLLIRVEDDGPGPAERAEEDDSDRAAAAIGLANTRARLEVLYGDRAAFTLSRSGSGGAVAELRIPLDHAADA